MRFFFLFFLFFSFGALADQEEIIYFELKISLFDENDNPLTGASIELIRNDSLISTHIVDENGQVLIRELPVYYNYLVKFQKMGYVTKLAAINTQDFYGWPNSRGLSWDLNVSLFKENNEFDFSYLNHEPMIYFYFNYLGYQDYDRLYLDKMILKVDLTYHNIDTLYMDSVFDHMETAYYFSKYKQIDSAVAYYEKAYEIYSVPFLANKVAETKEKEKAMLEKFSSLLFVADSLYATGQNYVDAFKYYEKADKIIRNKSEVESKLVLLKRRIYGENRPRYRSKIDASRGDSYYFYLEEAYRAFELNNYELAIKNYETALDMFPEIAFPKAQIEKMKALQKK